MEPARTAQEVAALRALWERAEPRNASPMQRPSWTIAAAETVERDAELQVFSAEGDGGAAVAPLVWRRSTGRFELPGQTALGEPIDFVFSSPEALGELAEQVAATGRPVDLLRVPADSPTLAALRDAFGRALVHESESLGTPTIALEEGWQEPESMLSSRRRSDMRRARRRAEAVG